MSTQLFGPLLFVYFFGCLVTFAAAVTGDFQGPVAAVFFWPIMLIKALWRGLVYVIRN